MGDRVKLLDPITVREGDALGDQHGYSHYSGRPVTPDVHDPYFVQQTLGDGYQCFCSCGSWRGWGSYYRNDRGAMLEALKEAHAEHARAAGEEA